MRQAGLSFRGTAAALAVFATAGDTDRTPDRTPSATTVRAWVLRLGYAHLTRPLSHDHRWVWLIDHTLPIGATKLFVIVGVPLDHVPFGVRPLQLADLHLVAMVPMATSNQERVADALEVAVARTGVPHQIVADGGSDLQRGIDRFRDQHPQTVSVPDAAHHAANLLKYYWANDPQWAAFTRRMTETAATIRQTRAAHLLAPKLRNKARFLSAGTFVRFGRLVLRRLRDAAPDADVVRHYAWVSEYANAVQAWGEQHDLVRAMLDQVRVDGLFTRGEAALDDTWDRLGVSDHPTTAALRNRLRAYVGRYGRGLPVGERLVGSTDVLESAFGVQKRLSRDQSQSGLTVLSAGLGALLGEVTPEQMRAEIDRVPEKAVNNWAARTFGKTVQWLRRRFVNPGPCTTNGEPNPG
ncbi:hypothetical protein FRUB_07360 [Fimbriiglobus ruber]|uniref:Uncharacterized protein n=1 Tax=Fimbriiglobus ruber TaxID=1908690 RepID=A0A225D3Z9_9BACT|nr:hypothetical protein FRUB_08236 [Fimbriiglobus ruber]OWK38240.1 hypothetical protein FRUB_07360 [Fimbriiglobus ruber]